MTYKNTPQPASAPVEPLFGGLHVLSDADLERIREQALRTLTEVGVRFDDPEARKTLADAGATVVGDIVQIPRSLVDEARARFRSPVVLGAKDSSLSIGLGQRRFVTTNGFGTSKLLEAGGQVRAARLDDLVFLTRLADGLPEVGYCQHQATPQDVPQELLDIVQAVAVLANTRKHCHLSNYSAHFADLVFELGDIAGGEARASAPVYSVGCCSLSPLRYPQEATVLLRKAAERGVPFLVVVGAVAGVTAPVTLAGALVVQTAEHLAALVLAQCVRAGAPIAFGSFTSPMDPRSGRQRLGAAELSLLNGATAQICSSFGVPFGYGTGGVSDARAVGVQTGIEKTLTTLSAALSGVEVIHDGVSGILEAGLLVSIEQMVIDHELCRVVRRILRGVDVNEETLAEDVVRTVGPGGNYLTAIHTAKHFRKEILLSSFWDDATRSSDDSCASRAHDVAVAEVRAWKGPYLSEHQAQAMVDIWCRVGLPEAEARRILEGADGVGGGARDV